VWAVCGEQNSTMQAKQGDYGLESVYCRRQISVATCIRSANSLSA
jgi:hypothetical protein